MAFAEKYFIEHKTQVRGSTTTTTTTRIELHEDGFVGSATELDGRGDFWTHEYENLDPVEIFKEPVQKSRLEMHINISDATDKAILTDIFAGDDDDFRLVKKVNGTIVWTGAVITDLLDYPESGYPFQGTIIAKDLTGTEGDYYTSDGTVGGSLQSGYETIITTIANLLDYTGYGLDIHTYTSWKEDNMTDSTDDFLNEVTNDIFALRDYARTGDESDEPITVFEALKEVCRNHGLILRQANGAWRLYHRSALSDPTAVDEYIYNSSGTQTSKNTGASQVDISVSADRIVRYVLPKSRNKFNKGLKSAKVKYDHRTQISGIVYPNTIELADSSTESFSQPFISDGNQTISLSFSVHVETDVDEDEMEARVRITSGSYYLQDDLSWTTSTNSYVEFLLTKGKPLVGGGNVWRGSVSILTDNVPDAADGTLTVQFAGASGTTDFADTTEYYDINFTINNPSVDENSTFIDYELIQSGAYSGRLDYGSIWYGDGPTGYSRGALKTGSTLALESWYVKGEVSLINHAEILLREILDNQRVTTRNLRADLYGSYIADKVLVHDSTNFFFLGGQQTGKQNRWDADFIELNNQTGSDTFRKLPKFADEGDTGSAGTGGGGGGTTGVTINEGDDRWLNESENGADIPNVATFRDNIALGSTDDVTFNSATLNSLSAPSDFIISLNGNNRMRFVEDGKTDGGGGDIFFFGDYEGWSTAGGGLDIGVANNFHAWWGVNDPVRVEFESDQGEMQFYLEGGSGKDSWYGLQEGATHHWSFGQDASESGDFIFATGFGLGSEKARLQKDGALSVGAGSISSKFAVTESMTGANALAIFTQSNASEGNGILGVTQNTETDRYIVDLRSGGTAAGDRAFTVWSDKRVEAHSNLFVRGGLFVKEFVVDQTRVMYNFSMSPEGGKISTVTGSTGSEVITFEDEAGNEFVPVSEGSVLRIQERTGLASGAIVKSLWRVVSDVTGNNITLSTSGITWTTGSDVGSIEVGDYAVQRGHTTDTDLDGRIDFNVSGVDMPYISIWDGSDDVNGGFEALRVGGMSGFDAGITGDVGIAGATSADGTVFWITEDEAQIGAFTFNQDYLTNGDIFIGNDLNNATTVSAANKMFIGNFGDGTNPYIRVTGTGGSSTNLVQMRSRSVISESIFLIRSGGNDVMSVSGDGAEIANLDIAGTLTMGASGEITNSGGDFELDSNGFNVNSGTGPANAYSINGGTDFEIFNNGSGRNFISSLNGNRFTIEAGGGNLEIESTSDDVIIISGGQTRMPGLPTSNPGGTDNLWNDGGTVKIT